MQVLGNVGCNGLALVLNLQHRPPPAGRGSVGAQDGSAVPCGGHIALAAPADQQQRQQERERRRQQHDTQWAP